MRALLVEPMKHPRMIDVDDNLTSIYKILECQTITAVYPWKDRVALVTDDNGYFSEKPLNRYIPELRQCMVGNFFLCGLGLEDFTDLPEDLIPKYTEMFWSPEQFLRTITGIFVLK